jgi:hypothetical protein
VPAALAQSPKSVVSGLQENQGLIGQCRRLNQTATVFNNTNLGPRDTSLVTLPEGTEVRLTGVVLSGRAQIFLGNNFNGLSSVQPVGWISTNFLASSCGGGTQTPSACFRANVLLDVRPTPDPSGNRLASYEVGEIFAASTNPPTRKISNAPGSPSWLEIRMFNGSIGWVVEMSSSGQQNATQQEACPPGI